MPEMLDPFPEIKALGQDRLQQLCNDWCRSLQASEFSIPTIKVTPDCRILDFQVELHANNYDKGDPIHFPLDRVLEFIIENSFTGEDKDCLTSRLRELRQNVGGGVYQRYKVALQAYTMALRCPTCSHGLLTQFRIFEGHTFKLDWIDPITCPRCEQIFTPSETDFFPIKDPDYPRGM